MARVRCTCGVLLSSPPGRLTVRCPRCYATIVCPQTQQLSPISTNGKKRAVLIRMSYQGQSNYVKRRSAYNVWLMNRFLVSFLGFPRESVVVLTELSTKENMLGAFRGLMEGCQPGHSLVFFYSGRSLGSLRPVDYATQGEISDVDINAAIVKPLPQGAKLHAIIDTCQSGTFLGLPFMYNNQRNIWEAAQQAQQTSPPYQGTSGGTAICFSICDDPTASTSDDVTGALTSSFIEAVRNERDLTYGSLLQSIRTKFGETQNRQNPQVPQLSSSDQSFDINSKPF